MVALALVPEPQAQGPAVSVPPRRGLILGHGGGSIAKWLARYWPELTLDIVEVDPSVVRAAERYFSYTPPASHHVYVKDARLFLRTATDQYDVIWVDAFARHLVPFHLTTKEFFAEVRSHLKPNGVLTVNLASSGNGPDRLRSQAVVATMRTSFPVIESFAVKGSKGADNLIFFAGTPAATIGNPEFADRLNRLIEGRRMPAGASALLATRRETAWQEGVVLTDDYAPFDLLMGRGEAGMAMTTGGMGSVR